ncbi:unnamed protein product [Orchesella dallaii]|uniref:Uncharacterized protein n=1 Tax=Orchesella dallaii TaxID=48710 RepID=A0ABP1PLK0_9HEXA
MWGLASQAGAGVAIAGLTATYYALVRRNYQMEREAVHRESAIAITGQGDGQYDFDNKQKDSRLNTSQLLLKKELQELALLNGSTSGLNIIYHPAPYLRYQNSDFSVRPIISRVNTRPSTNFSDEEFDFSTEGENASTNTTNVSLFGSDPVIETVEKTASTSTYSQTDEDFSDNNLSEKEKLGETSDESSIQILDVNQEDEDSSVETLQSEKSNKTNKVVEKWHYVQDNLQLQRTNSPICFYKNPGFGNRYAFRMKEQSPLKPLVDESLDTIASTPSASTETSKEDKVEIQETNENDKETLSSSVSSSSSQSKQYKDSTLFLLSPFLSESNVSVCEKDIQEKLSERSKSSTSDETISELEENKSTLETISEYNEILKKNAATTITGRGEGDIMPIIKLKEDPENCNLCPKTLPIPIKEEFPPTAPPKDVLEKEDDELNEIKENEQVNLDLIKKTDESETPNEDGESISKSPLRKEQEVKVLLKPASHSKPLEEEEADSVEEIPELVLISEPPPPEISLVDELVNAQPSYRICSPPSSPPPSFTTTSNSPRSSLVTNIPHDSWISLPIRVYFNSMTSMPWSTIGICIGVVVIAGLLGILMQRLAHEIVHAKNPR